MPRHCKTAEICAKKLLAVLRLHAKGLVSIRDRQLDVLNILDSGQTGNCISTRGAAVEPP